MKGPLAALSSDARGALRKNDVPAWKGVHWATPKLVAEAGFTEWTDDGRLRHPRFVGLREDEDPRKVFRKVPG